MRTFTLAKLAASVLVIGTVTVGCTPAGQAARVSGASDLKGAKLAEQSARRAAKALAKKDLARSIEFSEAAVAAMPRDARYRVLLGEAYLAAGRFASAETSFMDALTLDPENSAAALKLALVEIAVGKKADALGTLADYRDKLSASDFGLASALAGDVEGAVTLLEATVRDGTADAKTRQNLALVYAMAGKWTNARVMAVQDLPPSEADARIIQWMGFVRPQAQHDQVAALLGVSPVADAGQPTRLALAPAEHPVAVAAAEVALPIAEPAPAVVAVATPAPAPAAESQAPAFEINFAPRNAVVQAVPAAKLTSRPLAARPKIAKPASRPAPRTVEAGKFVVQLGAYANAAVAEHSWKTVSSRYRLASYTPVSANAKVGGANFIRLSVGGFANRDEAIHVCTRIKKAGGSCFVRGLASDAPARWVQRGLPRQIASR